jgi:ectoine hydroxylase-related dioxygenase (phytanoyl-CoA dioxygenase family)
MPALPPGQVAFFHEQGYLLLEAVLPPAAFRPLIRELEGVIEREARQAQAAGRLNDLFEGEPFDRRLAKIAAALEDAGDLWRAVHGKHHKTAGLFAVVTHPALLDIVEALIGPEILAHPQFNLRAKLPHHPATVVPWHQDLGYLQPEADATAMVNFWIPLVDAPMETGALQVIPGSHRWGLLPHATIDGYLGIPEPSLPPHRAVDCPVSLGGVLLLQHKTIHRSLPNLSDRVRWSLDLRYSDPAQPTGRPQVPGFLARSRARPDQVARSHRDWLQLVGER